MVIYLGLPSPTGSSNLPGSRRAALCSLFGLASDGVYMCPGCYQPGGSLLHCLSTLTSQKKAVSFCCTGLGVTSTGRYPASCPVKPGLSSPAAFRRLQLRLSVLLKCLCILSSSDKKVKTSVEKYIFYFRLPYIITHFFHLKTK